MPTESPPTLLVVGGSGYLGRHVARVAADRGWRVVTTSHRTPGHEPLDLGDGAAVDALVDRVRPTAVVNCAYVQHGDDAATVNVDGAGHVAAAARRVGARLVHLSTDVVFDGRLGRSYLEADPPTPLSPYGRTKAEAEAVVAAAHPGAVLVRTSLIYGGPDGEVSGHERLAADPAATFFTDELRNPVQVDDLAAVVVELCEPALAAVSGPLHVAGPDAVSRQELASLVVGHEVPGAPAPPGRPLDCRLDSSRARSLLATRLRGVREVWHRTPPAPPT